MLYFGEIDEDLSERELIGGFFLGTKAFYCRVWRARLKDGRVGTVNQSSPLWPYGTYFLLDEDNSNGL